MPRSQRYPHGMTANMLEIVKVNEAARMNQNHYGAHVSQNDMSKHLDQSKGEKKMICEVCGAEIISTTGKKRRFCDDCAEIRAYNRCRENKRKHANGEYVKPAIITKCVSCGREIVRHTTQKNVKCDQCKKETKRAQNIAKVPRKNAKNETY